MQNRIEVLRYSLLIEKLTSLFLGHLLDIKDVATSRTLGNKGSSLSFNTKVDLLIDIGALSDEAKSRFQTFMEIRNQFMHNSEIESFEKCMEVVNKEKFLISRYPQNSSVDKEEQMKNAVIALSKDVLSMTNDITKKLIQKLEEKANSESNLKLKNTLFDTLNEMTSNLPELISERSKIDPDFAQKDPKFQTLLVLTNLLKEKFANHD